MYISLKVIALDKYLIFLILSSLRFGQVSDWVLAQYKLSTALTVINLSLNSYGRILDAYLPHARILARIVEQNVIAISPIRMSNHVHFHKRCE